MAENKLVLAYSGGLDTSVAVSWLIEKYGADIITLTIDLGDGGPGDDSTASPAGRGDQGPDRGR